ncbi:MAG TPA: hypothetical protein VF322_08460 [Gammaproteobacteria bacterium]
MSVAPPERNGPRLEVAGLNGRGEQGTPREDGAQAGADAEPPRVPIARTHRDLERLLARVKHDLDRLPRHEWDNYLWNLCSALVRTHSGARHAPARPADDDGSSGP